MGLFENRCVSKRSAIALFQVLCITNMLLSTGQTLFTKFSVDIYYSGIPRKKEMNSQKHKQNRYSVMSHKKRYPEIVALENPHRFRLRNNNDNNKDKIYLHLNQLKFSTVFFQLGLPFTFSRATQQAIIVFLSSLERFKKQVYSFPI